MHVDKTKRHIHVFRGPLRLPSAYVSDLWSDTSAVRLSSENYRPQVTLREIARCPQKTGWDKASACVRARGVGLPDSSG